MELRRKSVEDHQNSFRTLSLQALLDQDDSQTEQLNVDQSTVGRWLKTMGIILKFGRWVPHELNERQQENRKNPCEILLTERY